MLDPDARPIADPPLRFYGYHDSVVSVSFHEPDARHPAVPEPFVQDLWQRRLFSHAELRTVCGRRLVVVRAGTLNTDAGPDFTDAWIRLDDIEWRGQVEIHVSSGTWRAHGHHEDPGYDGCVLHVVLYTDLWTGRLHRADGTPLPELVLFPYLTAPLRTLLYAFHTRATDALVCASHWDRVPPDLRRAWIRSLALQRLHERGRRISAALASGVSVADALHRALYRGLGYAKNADAMEDLARRLPLDVLRRYPDPVDLAALHLGTAGLLDDAAMRPLFPDPNVTSRLEARCSVLSAGHGLEPMRAALWKRSRLRPAGTPVRRILQAAGLVRPGALLHGPPLPRLRAAVLAPDALRQLRDLFSPPPVHPAEESGAASFERETIRPIGRATVDRLLINAVIPVLAAVAREGRDHALDVALLGLLAAMPAENDTVTRRFSDLGTPPEHAMMSQGLHALYRGYCRNFRCLQCAIGRFILNRPGSAE